jgi:5'-phosphate synthase pdxT subunit
MKNKNVKIGVLALQGAFIEHIEIIEGLNAGAVAVRLPRDLTGLQGLIIPGGESTTIMKLMYSFALVEPLRQLIKSGFPVWGTCAGMICLADCIVDDAIETLAVMNMTVRRNAFGRQVDSFEVDLNIAPLGKNPFHAVFIRAPVIERVGNNVTVLGSLENGKPVAARQGNMLVTSFHPELTEDPRFHRYFLDITAHSGNFTPA